ncbi:MAG TPA: phage portal protein [Burkholderiales bacterium]|nr:phage portal protein [Burkholderiales bacterium]
MGLIRRIADVFDPPREQRAQEISWDALRGGIDTGSAIVNARTAENLSTVMACVGAISTAMASLPAYVYRRLEKGREIDETHAVARLIANGPNAHQSWPDWMEWVFASVLLRGNALSEIIHDARGAVVGLVPIPWEFCSVQLLPSGRLAYDVSQVTSINGGTGKPRRLLQDEVFHLRDRSDDGLLGRSRLQRAAAVVSAGLSIQEFGNSLYRNGVNPSGALFLTGKVGDIELERIANNVKENFAGPSKTGRVMVLGGGEMKWQQISISPEDAEFLASRRFATEELCRLFSVPPPIAGDLTHGTFSNTETLVRLFATNTLTPWVRKLECEFSRSVFSAASRNTHSLELDLSGLLRGDPEQRWRSYEIAVKNNILDVDEVREAEGYNPHPRREAAIA